MCVGGLDKGVGEWGSVYVVGVCDCVVEKVEKWVDVIFRCLYKWMYIRVWLVADI